MVICLKYIHSEIYDDANLTRLGDYVQNGRLLNFNTIYTIVPKRNSSFSTKTRTIGKG